MQPAPIVAGENLLSLDGVRSKTGLGRSTLYRMIDEARFPRPLRVGEKAVRWRESEIDEWISKLPRTSPHG